MNITTTYNYVPIEVFAGTCIFYASCAFFFVCIGYIHQEQPPLVTFKPPQYAEKYYEAFEEFPLDELEEDQMKSLHKKYVKEDTDKGTVIMCYDYASEAFHFWSDNTIPFQSLDAVAQLYTMVYWCKAICVNYKAEYEKEVVKQQQEEESPQIPITEDGPFATFKSYNTNYSKKNKKVIIPEKCNHFRKCGTIKELETREQISNWSPTDISDSARMWCKSALETVTTTETLTYKEWAARKDKML